MRYILGLLFVGLMGYNTINNISGNAEPDVCEIKYKQIDIRNVSANR